MTILPNKQKKPSSKGERHNSLQAKGTTVKNIFATPNANTDCKHQTKQSFRKEDGNENNSDDEYGPGFRDENLEIWFEDRLRRVRGLTIKQMRGDGACLFRAVADQIYGDEEMHADVRRLCLDYMEKNRDHFSQFITEDFSKYIARKRRNDEHGNHVELQAISEIFSRPIEIYEYCVEPKNIFNPRIDPSSSSQPNPPIRLSYHGAIHYNSVIDPLNATVGVGLGLPGYSPGSADRDLMRDALKNSEIEEIEEAMLKDKIEMSDFERTEQQINEQIARESFMEYLKNLERKKEGSQRSSAGMKRLSGVDCEPGCSRSPDAKMRPVLNNSVLDGISEWASAAENDADERALLAQVMALSQQEFLNSLKSKSEQSHPDQDQAGTSKSS